jgi:methylmalonyl-CoA mutase C-terminal domain/subunit
LLEERQAADILLFGGGIIPDEDMPKLHEMGVDGVFTPGASTQNVVDYLRQAVPQRWAAQGA